MHGREEKLLYSGREVDHNTQKVVKANVHAVVDRHKDLGEAYITLAICPYITDLLRRSGLSL